MISKKTIKQELKKVAGYFEKTAQNTILKKNFYKHINEIFNILKLSENRTHCSILDVGGGLAVNLLVISSLGYKYNLYLLDRFDEYIEGTSMGHYNKSIADLFESHNIHVINKDIITNPSFPFKDLTFDIVTIFDVVEHFPKHPLEVLKEIKRTLKDESFIILTGPNLFGLSEVTKFLTGQHPYIKFNAWIKDNYYSHYREYTKKEYCKLLILAGFKIIKSQRTYERFISPAISDIRLKNILYMIILLFTIVFYNFRPSVFVIGQKSEPK